MLQVIVQYSLDLLLILKSSVYELHEVICVYVLSPYISLLLFPSIHPSSPSLSCLWLFVPIVFPYSLLHLAAHSPIDQSLKIKKSDW